MTAIATLQHILRASYTKDEATVSPEQLNPPGASTAAYVERDTAWRAAFCIFTMFFPGPGILRLSRPLLGTAVLIATLLPFLLLNAMLAYGNAIPFPEHAAWINGVESLYFGAGLIASIYCWRNNRWHSTNPHWSSHGFTLLVIVGTSAFALNTIEDHHRDRFLYEQMELDSKKFELDR